MKGVVGCTFSSTSKINFLRKISYFYSVYTNPRVAYIVTVSLEKYETAD